MGGEKERKNKAGVCPLLLLFLDLVFTFVFQQFDDSVVLLDQNILPGRDRRSDVEGPTQYEKRS